MKRQAYMKPIMTVVEIQQTAMICLSKFDKTIGNAGLGFEGAGDGIGDSAPRSRQFDDWD